MKTCCFIGHRNVLATDELCDAIKRTVLELIVDKGVQIFLFGSASNFDELSLKIVTEIKKDYPFIKRVYYRAQYPIIEKWYKDYLLGIYDDTLFPSSAKKAGKASYVERNQAMIDASDFCIFYYDERYLPSKRKRFHDAINLFQPKSGTKLAYEYAIKKQKQVFNLF